MKLDVRIAIVISLLLVIFSLIYTKHSFIKAPLNLFFKTGLSENLKVVEEIQNIKKSDHKVGDIDSPNVVIEYSDYFCSVCKFMRPRLRELAKNHDALLVYRHLYRRPTSLGYSRAVVAECVAKNISEDKFEEFSDYLYENQRDLKQRDIDRKALTIGLSQTELDLCKQDKDITDKIDKHSNEAKQIGAGGTPFIVFVKNGFLKGVSYGGEYESLEKRFLASIDK